MRFQKEITVRHKKLSIALSFVLVAAIAALLFLRSTVADAQSHRQNVDKTLPSIPKVWGSCRGAAGQHLIFEGADGTIRLVNLDSVEDIRVVVTLTRK